MPVTIAALSYTETLVKKSTVLMMVFQHPPKGCLLKLKSTFRLTRLPQATPGQVVAEKDTEQEARHGVSVEAAISLPGCSWR